MRKKLTLQAVAVVLSICCLNVAVPTVNAFLGFGDEEKIPGHWDGPQSSHMTFEKDGRGVMQANLGFFTTLTMNFNWSVSGGYLTQWDKDNTFAGAFAKIFGANMTRGHKIVFHGPNEFVLDGKMTFTRSITK